MPPQNRHFSSHMYPKSAYAAPSTPPNMVQTSQSVSPPVAIPPYYLGRPLPQGAFYDNGMPPRAPSMPARAAQPQTPSNGYNTPNFNNYATAGGRMASGLGYNDPVVNRYLAQQQRNQLTPQQRAYVDSTQQVMANRMAGTIPPGPRTAEEAAANNVTGPSTGSVYTAAAQRQAARAEAYRALVARRYGRTAPMATSTPGAPGSPTPVSVTYGQNGLQQTPVVGGIAMPPSPSPAAPATAGPPMVRTVPNMVFPQGIHSMPTQKPFAVPPTPLQTATSAAFNNVANNPIPYAGSAIGKSMGNLLYGNPPIWNPTLPKTPASPTSTAPKPAANLNSSRWPRVIP